MAIQSTFLLIRDTLPLIYFTEREKEREQPLVPDDAICIPSFPSYFSCRPLCLPFRQGDTRTEDTSSAIPHRFLPTAMCR